LSFVSPVRELVHDLKFRRNMAVAPLLSSLLAERVAAEPGGRPQVLLPVPLHKTRLRERGFNQAVEIARPLARELGIPLDVAAGRRARKTIPQSQLEGAAARRENLRGAFLVPGEVKGLHLALVDDVVTTGATVGELAAALIREGARRVDVWACCRALPPAGAAR